MTAMEKLKAWRIANPDKLKAQRARYWKRHGATHSVKVKAWRAKNPDKVRAQETRWRNEHRDRVRELGRNNYARHRTDLIAKVTEYQRQSCANLGDYYIRHKLSRETKMPLSSWPDSLVELKRAELKLLRLCRQQRKLKTELPTSTT